MKGDFRLAKVPTTVGGIDIPAGTTLMVLNGAANRDARHFESPGEFRPDRANSREHLAFGHGAHFCPGPRWRELRGAISLQRMLDRMLDIRIDEAEHGPPGARRFRYFPTYILRGLKPPRRVHPGLNVGGDLEGKVAIVTGGAGGIGRAIVETLRRRGRPWWSPTSPMPPGAHCLRVRRARRLPPHRRLRPRPGAGVRGVRRRPLRCARRDGQQRGRLGQPAPLPRRRPARLRAGDARSTCSV